MSWIKRNLKFLLGGFVAVALLGLAGYYCYSKWELNNSNLKTLDDAYLDWERISGNPLSPGNDKIDNIKLAGEHRQQVRAMIKKLAEYFAPIPPIPNASPTAPEFPSLFRSALRKNIDQLQKDAANNNVALTQQNYFFSFRAQKDQFNFAPGSLGPLSVQLGEVRAICDVLFRARINSLDALQRERTAADGVDSAQVDYVDPALLSVTNDLAVLTPYVITFHCFSTELAGVLTGFANAPHGFIVKTVNVDPGSGGATGADPSMAGGGAVPGMPGFGAPVANPAATPGRGGVLTVLDEKPLKVTMVVDVVKLLPKK